MNVSGDAVEISRVSDQSGRLCCNAVNPSSTSSMNSSPITPQPPEVIEEIKYKLDRAVFGTNV